MVHAFHHSLSDVIDGRVVVKIAGIAAVWVPASKAPIAMFCLLKAISLINRQKKCLKRLS